MIHLACHGKMEDNNPCLFLDSQAVSLSQLVDTEESQLAAHPLVVLSACELGGFSASDFSAEQFGFPAGLIAMGARSVVGALWPVPDQPTAEFMEDFHRHLQKFPSNEALPLAIMDAQRRQVSALTWGSFVHFGV
jgi:CHAT domain-containing protein